MSERTTRTWARARHRDVALALASLDARFLDECECWFGGGTRIVLELGEYRESADIDFLCVTGAGYRALRSTVTPESLGKIVKVPVSLVREVRADRYGIRTFLSGARQPLKLEFILEGRIGLSSVVLAGIPVRCLDHAHCFAEKFLANADRWLDASVHSRDLIDLAFMMAALPRAAAARGLAIAAEAYGTSAEASLDRALAQLKIQPARLAQCARALAISDLVTLRQGLAALQAKRWRRTASI